MRHIPYKRSTLFMIGGLLYSEHEVDWLLRFMYIFGLRRLRRRYVNLGD